MEDAAGSGVAQALERFAACIGAPSSFPTPTNHAVKVHAKARWLIQMLAWVRATLDDAEDMDITEESVCRWLRELRAVADAAEDVLGEFPHEASRLGLMGDDGWTAAGVAEDATGEPPGQGGERTWAKSMIRPVRSGSETLLASEVFAFLCGVDQRIEEIISRYLKIEKPEPALQVEHSKGQALAEISTSKRATSSVMDEPLILGRDGDLAIVKQFFKNVSEMVERTSTHALGFLPHKDSLELFKQHAFQGRNSNLYPNLVTIGEEIARRCGGVPLVAKTLGGLLRTKDDEEDWTNILESKVWDATMQETSIIPILRLSYRHLPAPLKRCFRFCSVFPKNYPFVRDRIIRMWMGHGYIKAIRKRLTEDVGQMYIDDLLSRSLFQKHAVIPGIFQMHDLMHDLARCVSWDECYRLEGDTSRPIPAHVRHLSILTTSALSGLTRGEISEQELIRSLLLPGSKFSLDDELQMSVLFTRMECLRVLDLGATFFHVFPRSITLLKHLRYLYIKNNLQQLPEAVGSLYHLQTLELQGQSKWFRLSNCISNLLNLRHLRYNNNIIPVTWPVGIGKLKDLQTMPGFCVSPEHNCAKLGELKDINNIRGQFAIKGLNNVANVTEAKKAYLENKRGITSLRLEWDPRADSSCIDDEVLESLKPSVKLGSLHLSGFKGPSYPSWLGDPSFSRLGTVKLEICEKWTSLPPLGQLPSLKSLRISRATGVEYIGGEFFCGGFPHLEELTLEDMVNWKSWCGAQEGQCPKLGRLTVASCLNLESLSLINLGAVKNITIRLCPKLQCMSSNSLQLSHLPQAQTIEIQHICKVRHISADFCRSPRLELEDVGQREVEYMLGMCSHICGLTVKIYGCPELRITSVSPPPWQLPSLQEIHVEHIHGAGRIVAYGKSRLELNNVDPLEVSFLLNGFSHIRQLVVTQCANLSTIPWTKLTNLEHLEVSEVPLVQSLNAEQLPPTLRHLLLTRCEDLTSLPLTELTALKYLSIIECPLFQLLNAEQLPPTLQVLCIYGKPCKTEQCSRHQHFQRLKQVQQSSKEGGEDNLYLLFRNVQNASEASALCSLEDIEIRTLEIEWDCCFNVRSNVVDSVAEEVLGKLYHPLNFFPGLRSLHKLVIRGYTGSRFTSLLWDPSLHSLSSLTLQQCSKCEILPPLSQLRSLKELYVQGASSLESVVEECLRMDNNMSEEDRQETKTHIAFPRLEKLEFHGMPVWKEWSDTKEGDFPLLHKLVLKHCPTLRALPHLPPRLKELELEACHELTSLSSFGSHHSQGLKFLNCFSWLSLINFVKQDLSAITEGPPPTLHRMSLTNCPLLLTWCEEHSGTLVHIPNIWLDGVRIPTRCRKHRRSIRSRIERIRKNGEVSHASELNLPPDC
ncbi:hypothetical protein Taro_055818 [Colocasia esculenta]|uniref:Uncharacterized protein n=1 Tax=Colocasia esculenta TaxID=4460 RepID=A0A843XUN3_COLES|nr:hypothetical protein [Colocasia esculenta]